MKVIKDKIPIITLFLIGIWSVLVLTNTAMGFEVPVHALITKAAVDDSVNYKTFIKTFNQIGTKRVINGSRREDDLWGIVRVRPRHHFYDPTNGDGLSFPLCFNRVRLG